MSEKKRDPRVEVIRADKRVGRGSCSSVDECWSDEELLAALQKEGVSISGAVRWAHGLEAQFREQGLNQRWGEDSDEQLRSWKEWKEIEDNE